MAIEKLKFTRDWTDPQDFPTIEVDESKVRADLQCLHDEAKDYLNETVVPALDGHDGRLQELEDDSHRHENRAVLDGIAAVTAVLGTAQDKVPSEKAVRSALDAVVAGQVTPAQIGAAPAGFGLGLASGATVSDANEIAANGWFVSKTNSPTGDWCHIFNICYTENRATQFAYRGYLGAQGMSVAHSWKREKASNVWGEWEWIDPPLEIGVEYRTTERFQGKPVYVKAVDFGTMPSQSDKSVTLGGEEIRALDCYAYSPSSWVAYGMGTNKDGAVVHLQRHVISVSTTINYNERTLVVVVKYFKATD